MKKYFLIIIVALVSTPVYADQKKGGDSHLLFQVNQEVYGKK